VILYPLASSELRSHIP